MDTQTPQRRDYGFALGLLTGSVVGAGLAIWFAPRLTESARKLGKRAAEQYRQASSQIADAADDLVRRGNGVRDDVAGAVARGAHEVERVAMAAKSDRH